MPTFNISSKAGLEAVELDQVFDHWLLGITAPWSNLKDKASDLPESRLAQVAPQQAASGASAAASTSEGIQSTAIQHRTSLVPQSKAVPAPVHHLTIDMAFDR